MGTAIADKGETFEKIRLVASDLFGRAGYHGTGMRSLAAAVGIQVGSLYNHFESKQSLLFELISEYESNLSLIFKDRRLSRCDSAVQMNGRLWNEVALYISKRRNFAQVTRYEAQHLSGHQVREIDQIRHRRLAQLRILLAQYSGDMGLGDDGLQMLCQELHALLDCFIKLEAEPQADPNNFVRQQLRNMASMLLVKRD